jgi:hypothetical protein
MTLCQINECEGPQEETKRQTDPEKTAYVETGKAEAYGCAGRFGTLGRSERKEGAYEGACT